MDILLAILFIVVCVMLIIVILLQKGRGGGLGAAFGGSSSSAFGARIGDVFTWITIVLTALFLLLAIGTTLLLKPAPRTPVVTIDPPASPIAGPRQVALSGDPEGTTVYYTIDGSDPMNEDTRKKATGPFQIQPGTTVRAVAEFRGKWSQPYAFDFPDLNKRAAEQEQEQQPAESETPSTAPAQEETESPESAPADAEVTTAPAEEEPATAPTTASVTG